MRLQPNSGTTGYTYDTKDQLTQEQSQRNGGYTNAFGYDSAGNPTTFRGASHTFNANNQNIAGIYDGNGNPSARQSSNLGFDPENRLTAYGSTLTTGFNGDGLRAWKQSSNTRTYFLYDGSEPVCELDGTGNVTATNTFGSNGLLSRRVGTASVFYTFDLQGSVAQRLNGSSIVSFELYDAFGNRQSTGGMDIFEYGGQWGYYTDAETGLVLCTHRYYDPQQGRWLTHDPLDYAGGINLYRYCGNDPVNNSDPDGTKPRPGGGPGWQNGIVTTVFGGPGDPNNNAYTGKPINGNWPGASLPARVPPGKRCIEIYNPANGKRTTAPIVDVGPLFTNDPYWNTDSRPRAEDPRSHIHRHPGNHAGLDVTPGTANTLGIDGKGKTNWRFIPCPRGE